MEKEAAADYLKELYSQWDLMQQELEELNEFMEEATKEKDLNRIKNLQGTIDDKIKQIAECKTKIFDAVGHESVPLEESRAATRENSLEMGLFCFVLFCFVLFCFILYPCAKLFRYGRSKGK